MRIERIQFIEQQFQYYKNWRDIAEFEENKRDRDCTIRKIEEYSQKNVNLIITRVT